jgi:hypothetical protein
MRSLRPLSAVAVAALSAVLAACSSDDGSGLDCDPATTLTLTVGAQLSDAIDRDHCISGGDPGDLFTLTVAQTSVVRFTATSSAFPPEISITKPGSPASAEDEVAFKAGSPARAVVVLSPGQYLVDIQSSDNAVGAYTLTTEAVGLNACYHANGIPVFLVPGQTLASEIATTDCPAPNGAHFEIYTLRLRAGRSYTFTATTAIDQFNLRFGTATTTLAGDGVITTNGSATITHTPSTSGYYLIGFGPIGNRHGAYTLSVTP